VSAARIAEKLEMETLKREPAFTLRRFRDDGSIPDPSWSRTYAGRHAQTRAAGVSGRSSSATSVFRGREGTSRRMGPQTIPPARHRPTRGQPRTPLSSFRTRRASPAPIFRVRPASATLKHNKTRRSIVLDAGCRIIDRAERADHIDAVDRATCRQRLSAKCQGHPAETDVSVTPGTSNNGRSPRRFCEVW
jgi:hypothetical protein